MMKQSRDGRWLAVGTYGGVVNIIDASVPQVTRMLSVGKQGADVEFLTDRTLLVGGKGGRIELWDIHSGNRLRVIRDEGEDLFSMTASPDGTRIAFSAFESSISIVDAANGRMIDALDPGGETVSSVKFSPDGKRLVSASMEGDLTAWDLERSTIVWSSRVLAGKLELVSSAAARPDNDGRYDHVTEIVFSPNGRSIAVYVPGGQVLIVDADSGKTLHSLAGTDVVESLEFMPDGRSLIVGYSGSLRRIEVEDGRETFGIRSAGRIDGISVDPTGAWIRTLEQDGFIIVRSAMTGRVSREGMGRSLWSAVYTKDGELLAAGSSDGSIDLFEMPAGKFLRRIDTGGTAVFGLTFSPDDRMLAETDLDVVRLWDPRTGAKLLEIDRRGKLLRRFIFSPEGGSLFLAEYKSIGEWDARLGSRIRELINPPNFIDDLAISPNGRYLAAGSGGRVYLWDRETAKEIMWEPETGKPFSKMSNIAFVADGRELAGLLMNDGDLYRISIPDGKIVEKRALGRCVRGALLIPDGIAVESRDDCKLGQWTIRSIGKDGLIKTRFKNFPGEGEVLAESPDGRRWITSNEDGVLSVWRVP